ncbi:Adenylyl_cyclase-associated protein [Hexamita inflata]|uniref:Adenylyl cyclase-associated protein n=1 Tax=Hexamita inflata TaxID=28002 RepID=A0AA86Q211_9EUKA|nr:Adenylyl cyclase-associated protein [Hexamita inflata]
MTDLTQLASLVQRLEAAVSKLESGSGSAPSGPSNHPITSMIIEVADSLSALVTLSAKIGPETVKMVENYQKNLKAFAKIAAWPFKFSAVPPEVLKSSLAPLIKKLPLPPRGKQDNAFKALEAAADFFLMMGEAVPFDFLKEQSGTVEYFNNRVRLATDIECGKEWAALLTKANKSFIDAVEQYYKSDRLRFTGKAAYAPESDVAEVKAEVKPEPKVEAPVKAAVAAPVKKAPKKEYNAGRKCHFLENIENETVEITADLGQSVQVFNCKNLTLCVNNKSNMISITKCENCTIALDTNISQIDVIQCKKVSVQVKKVAPTFNIEASETIKLYLSNASLNAEILVFKSAEIVVVEFEDENEKKWAVPTHFVTKFVNGKMHTEVVDNGNE